MDNGKWIMDNGELMMPFCIEIFHYPFFIIYLFNTQFINNVGGSCIFFDNYYGIAEIYSGGTV